ncbi:endonuclease-reverse transcriptase [Plakobranchus ocellatus]|uniref:Endonuclease-reverse transcriptase n=1 Tax=Plakobranchus ocellatus TaxID=259542 RepID=A0AAV4DRJ0_9GAST|nr:endonuclease-reverse transcriptase [Plakobranchus ocellatus]
MLVVIVVAMVLMVVLAVVMVMAVVIVLAMVVIVEVIRVVIVMKWAGHVARLKDNRWTLRVTDWQPRNGKRSRGRQARRWRDDIVKTKGNRWSRDARDRDEWKRDAEGYILQWMDIAS